FQALPGMDGVLRMDVVPARQVAVVDAETKGDAVHGVAAHHGVIGDAGDDGFRPTAGTILDLRPRWRRASHQTDTEKSQRHANRDPCHRGNHAHQCRHISQAISSSATTPSAQPIHSIQRRRLASSFGPPQAISPASRKKRPPRPTTEPRPKASKGMPAAPEAMVNTLYGIGVKPATSTIQKPYSSNSVWIWAKVSA